MIASLVGGFDKLQAACKVNWAQNKSPLDTAPQGIGKHFDFKHASGQILPCRHPINIPAGRPERRFSPKLAQSDFTEWKLCADVVDTSDGKKTLIKGLALYDLEKDRSESTNLAGKKPDLVKRLKKHHQKWQKNSFRN